MTDWGKIRGLCTYRWEIYIFLLLCALFLLDICLASVSPYVCFLLGLLKVFKCVAEISEKGY